ncbi:FAD-dependent oxidoreductase [Streptomyces sp. NBC_01352]|uniref:NAD(P)/FAD-dependent oxidoreductase n=1 Tax=Streptomyces sp. NBC_01352 TaxID=2903834 RepID=UPI002E306093|nr:FAD-dependent oxidoreductase [Streptomyces sp. NBC_01352]
MTGRLEHVVIVGASAAGLSAADGLREGGFDGTITVLGAERHPPYDRPTLSKSLLAAEGKPEPLALRSPERLAAARIELLLGHAASGLDIDRRYVITTYAEALPFDAVVLACGRRPRRIRTTGGEVLPTLRTPQDLHAIRQAAELHGELTVIGAGFIGLEVAAALAIRGVQATVLSATPLPLDTVVGPEIAATLRDLHLAHGVTLRMPATVESVHGGPGSYRLVLSDGSEHRTAFVLAGIGAEPDVSWLAGSGVDLKGGVVCDAAGRTGVPDVWAAGDVATFDHPLYGRRVRVEHWTHAIEQGRHVGLNIARGHTAPYTAVPYFWTDQYGHRFQSYGRRRPGDATVLAEGSLDDDFLVLFGKDQVFSGALARGRARSLRTYRKLLEQSGTWADARSLARVGHAADVS